MGWQIGYDDNRERDIGYGVPAVCDHPGCNGKIDRGLSYVCGEPYGGGEGCGLYFCYNHLVTFDNLCDRCRDGEEPYDPKSLCYDWVAKKGG